MARPAKQLPLKRFYDDKEIFEEAKNFFAAHLDQLGLQKVYAKEDTHGVADAKLVIENAFKQLEETFGPKEKTKEIVNEAR